MYLLPYTQMMAYSEHHLGFFHAMMYLGDNCISARKVPCSVLMAACHSLTRVGQNWSAQSSADGQLGGF